MSDCIAIIPARGGSKRLPRKNILPLAGRPMLAWPVGACVDSGVFARIIVSTDDAEIADIAIAAGAEAIMRPAHMATDTAHEFDAYNHVLASVAAEGGMPDYFCGIYPTAALIGPQDLQGGFAKMIDSDADVVMSVSALPLHPYKALETNADGYLQMVHPEWCVKRSQLYPHYVASNGTFYFLRTAPFLEKPAYYADKLVGYEIPFDRAVDIDTPEDYAFVQLLKAAQAGG